ncbi:MAG TPA: arsenate reductase ArsC [Candidatus Eisenbacteria bacterium]|jgi:protein-tyrosine-phosphatase|nr:arsenate reductase ArsC [Candidatus Eisenbacteria bacterium]
MRALFVCVENSGRSQMAEAFARSLGIDAASAGSKPSGQINPRTIEVMAEKGISLAGQRSKSLQEIPPGEWDYVVTMGCGDACPWVPARRREDWDLPDPKDLDEADFRRVRDEIEARVRKLLPAQ